MKQRLERAVDHLNDRWQIWLANDIPANLAYYQGMVAIVESMGFTVERFADGSHVIY